jgi:hypothetical protein
VDGPEVTATLGLVTPHARLHPVWRDRLIIAFAYTLAWGAMLLNRGLNWHDWTLFGQAPGVLATTYGEVGLPWFGLFHEAVFSLPLPGLAGHAITFVAYLLSTLALHAILRRTPGLGRTEALVAALTFAVLPVNYARIAVIDLPYGLCLLAFLVGSYLLLRHVEMGGIVRRLAALALFLCSFFTASLLVMYVAPILLGAYVTWRTGKLPIRSLVPRYADFLALPVGYWLVKAILFVPSGAYEGYNELTVRGLLNVPAAMVPIPAQVLLEPLYRASVVAGVAGLVAGAAGAIWLLWRTRDGDTGRLVAALLIALVGAVLVALGVLAYLAVGRVPTLWDWSSRHQLLVPIGAAVLAAAAVRAAQGIGRAGAAVGVAIGVLLGVSIVADARTLVAYQVDWYKQVALVNAARATPALQDARHIRVLDDAASLDAMRRSYRFYEYNALFELAIGGQRRLASGVGGEPSADEVAQFIARPAYHMREYVPTPVDLELRVTDPHGSPGTLDVLRLVMLEAIGSPSFDQEVSRLIDITASPIQGAVASP